MTALRLTYQAARVAEAFCRAERATPFVKRQDRDVARLGHLNDGCAA